MTDDQFTGTIIDVFFRKTDHWLHRQVEMRDGRIFMRLKKMSLEETAI